MVHKKTTIRSYFYLISVLVFIFLIIIAFYWLSILWLLIIGLPLFSLGIYDILQKDSNILRNYPVWGHWRYLLLKIRPEIHAYLIENEWEGAPFTYTQLFLVYNRAKKAVDTIPFGTQLDVHEAGYEWVNQSMTPKQPNFDSSTRVKVGGPQCTQPYSASRFNISAMSFGAISAEAVRALNRGAKMGNFYQDTGEGGLSKYHLMEGGDLVWEIGTAYFGCRTKNGTFDSEQFKEKSYHSNVKMIEIKISQGAKPSHGAILPGVKITQELAKARGIEAGINCLSPPVHSTFSTPIGLLKFVQRLRDLSGGKPTGFKLCIGIPHEFMAVCKAMLWTGIYPDFIVIDGSEGGTGAAPFEFSNSVGMPLNEGLIFVHNCLVGIDVRKHIRLIGSGKIVTGFDILTKIALGADILNSARAMMFALGCVQSRRCHLNTCPTGITTQDSKRRYALDVDKKAIYVKNFHEATLKHFLAILGAIGLERPEELQPFHICRRVSKDTILTYNEIFPYFKPNDILNGRIPEKHKKYVKMWKEANPHCFVIKPKKTN